MSLSFEFFLAFRYLRERSSGFSILHVFSLIAMVLGVATLISVMSVMNGFRHELVQNIMGIDGHIEINLADKNKSEYTSILNEISSIEHVKNVFPMTENQAMIKYHNIAAGVIVRGFQKSDMKDKFVLSHFRMSYGDIDDAGCGILIGTRLAAKLGVEVGDFVKIISPEGFGTIIGTIPRIATYKVVGIFEVGMFEYDEVLALLPLDLAQKVFSYKNSSIKKAQIFLSNPFYSRILSSKLKQTISGVSDWQDRQSYLLNALKVERNAMFFILSMIVSVASFGIVSSVVCVIERKKSAIAIMRTLGMTKFTIMRIFCFCGLMIGILGIFLGCLIGALFSKNIDNIRIFLEKIIKIDLFSSIVYFFSSLPSMLMMSDVIEVALMSFVLCIIATIIPSWMAACQEPSVVLRGE